MKYFKYIIFSLCLLIALPAWAVDTWYVAPTANDFAVQYINFGCISSDADADQTIYFDDVRYKAAGGGF